MWMDYLMYVLIFPTAALVYLLVLFIVHKISPKLSDSLEKKVTFAITAALAVIVILGGNGFFQN